jgi:hypothetical protein
MRQFNIRVSKIVTPAPWDTMRRMNEREKS